MQVKQVGAGLAIAGAAAAVYFRFRRPWHLNWGATPEEVSGEAAGDELIPEPDIQSTRVVEIDAPPSAIWPWLVQMGPAWRRAHPRLDRAPLGIDIRNTDRVIPELHDLNVGDEIPMPGYAMRVERLDPGRVIAVRSSNHAWVWSFELRPAGDHTRLISRNRFDVSALPVKDKLAYPVIEPGSWVMERKMPLTIKRRAGCLARTQATI